MMPYQTRLAAKCLRQGGLIAHQTSTLAGIAADVHSAKAIRKAQIFKQRIAPFLLLADSKRTALQQAVYISPRLRKLAKTSWPGAVTLVFRAKKQLNPACYQKGYIAIRVDSDVQTRQLAKQCGGLMLSSSFNRKGQAVMPLHRQSRMHFHRYIRAVLSSQQSPSGKASTIYKVTSKTVIQLR
jgi:tRNA threonylcarbamoyl adenosine modification protein (Sua5/YciO/YrdC/YwlC family)